MTSGPLAPGPSVGTDVVVVVLVLVVLVVDVLAVVVVVVEDGAVDAQALKQPAAATVRPASQQRDGMCA